MVGWYLPVLVVDEEQMKSGGVRVMVQMKRVAVGKTVIPQQRVNTPWLSECCQAVNKLSTSCQEKKDFCQNTFTQKIPKIETDEIFRVAVRWLSEGCQEAVGWLSGKNHHKFEQNKVWTVV